MKPLEAPRVRIVLYEGRGAESLKYFIASRTIPVDEATAPQILSLYHQAMEADRRYSAGAHALDARSDLAQNMAQVFRTLEHTRAELSTRNVQSIEAPQFPTES